MYTCKEKYLFLVAGEFENIWLVKVLLLEDYKFKYHQCGSHICLGILESITGSPL